MLMLIEMFTSPFMSAAFSHRYDCINYYICIQKREAC